MDTFNLILVAVAGLVLGLGLVSGALRRTALSDPLVSMVAGILLGPQVLGVLEPDALGDRAFVLEQAARLTLAVGLMGIALRLPRGYFRRNARSMAVMLGAVMPLMWLAGSLLAYGLLERSLEVALLIGAVVTPTDPIVASSIVTGEIPQRLLPGSLRHLLSAESGVNDGLAYPIVSLPLLALTAASPQAAASEWVLRAVLWEVGFAVGFGALLGWGAGRLLHWAEANRMIDKPSFLSYAIALAWVTLGAARILGSDGILAVFVAGVAFNRVVSAAERAQEERFAEALDRFFTLPVFLLFGLALPWSQWGAEGWPLALLALAILLLHRLPALLALSPLLPQLKTGADALFLGWFGPIGIAALYYANFAARQTGIEAVWTVASAIVGASIVAHGMMATPLTRRYGRRMRSQRAARV